MERSIVKFSYCEKATKCDVKVVSVEEMLMYDSHHTAKFEFSFLSLCVCIFKNFPTQFLSQRGLAEPVFCKNKSLILSCGRKFFDVC